MSVIEMLTGKDNIWLKHNVYIPALANEALAVGVGEEAEVVALVLLARVLQFGLQRSVRTSTKINQLYKVCTKMTKNARIYFAESSSFQAKAI